MKTAEFYQGTADAMGVALYLYPDGSVSNSRKAGVEPTAIIKPHDHWKPADDHGLGEQIAKILGRRRLAPAHHHSTSSIRPERTMSAGAPNHR